MKTTRRISKALLLCTLGFLVLAIVPVIAFADDEDDDDDLVTVVVDNIIAETATIDTATIGTSSITIGPGDTITATTGQISFDNEDLVTTGSLLIGSNGNTAVGIDALRMVTPGSPGPLDGKFNTAVGNGALLNNDSGSSNTAIGLDALGVNTSGKQNTAVGAFALELNDTGYDNTAIGKGTLSVNTTGVQNTAIGIDVMESNTTGEQNTAVGVGALSGNVDGHLNIAIGSETLGRVELGSNRNIAIGTDAGDNLANGSDNIYVGSLGPGAVGSESGNIRIGTTSTHGKTFIAGIRGVTTDVADAITVRIDSAGQLGTLSSSRRFKEDIRPMGDASSGLMRLRPVTFRYKKEYADGSRPLQYGLVAEEVAEVYPDLVTHSPEGEVEAVQYRKVNIMLLNEVQKLHRQLQVQQEQIADLTAQLTRLEALEAQRGSFAAQTK